MQPGITIRHFLQRCGMGAIPRTEQHMRRREFITLLGGAAAWPLVARAQQPVHVVGVLASQPLPPVQRFMSALRRALSSAAYLVRSEALELRRVSRTGARGPSRRE